MSNLRRYQIEVLAALVMLSSPNILEIKRLISKKLASESRYQSEVKKYSKSRRDNKSFKLKGIRP